MKRILGLTIGICLIGTLGFMVTGCGQATPTVQTGTPQPSGLSIRGTVYTKTLSGTRGNPIAGAVVSLSGDSASKTTTTDANGEYVISGIPDGSYILVVTAEGHKRSRTSVTIKPESGVPADNTITVEDIQLESNPIITSYSPTPNSVISQNPTFVVTFNEAMDTSTVIPWLTAAGVRSFALSGNTVPLRTSMPDGKTLIITPEAALALNQVYTLSINPGTTAKDTAGYPLEATGDQALAATVDYRVTTGGVPGSPEGVALNYYKSGISKTLTSDATSGIDFSDIVGMGWNDYLKLYWNPPSSGGAVTGYRIYASLDGSNYVLLGTSTENYYSFSVDGLLSALFGTTSIDPISTQNFPLINKPVYFKVVAYNGDGESAAAVTSGLKELVGPRLDTKAFSGRTGGTGFAAAVQDNNYYLAGLTAGTDTKIAYVAFNQPVDSSTIAAANFEHNDSTGTKKGTVVSATLLTSSSSNLSSVWTGNVYSIVKVVSDTDFAQNDQIKVLTGVKDLAGNQVASGTGDTVSIP